MGNTFTHSTGTDRSTFACTSTPPPRSRNRKSDCNHQLQQQQRHYQSNIKSKTLPARRSHASVNSHPNITGLSRKSSSPSPPPPPPPNGETSRVLFLLYLIHRTWNVVVETVDTRSKRSRRSRSASTQNCASPAPYFADSNSMGEGDDYSPTITDLDDVDASSVCCSQYSYCSCSVCYDAAQNVYNSIAEDCSTQSICQRSVSRCGSDFSSYYHGYQMAPSICQNSPKLPAHNNNTNGVSVSASSVTQKSNCGSSSINGSMASYKMSSSENSWTQPGFNKENQRPPVYNPEDYAQSLKKFGKRQNGPNARSIYDTSDTSPGSGEHHALATTRAATLPNKYSDYKSPIQAPPESDGEMSLRQFASITDLLTKLRADLRVSFPSFVQEFISTPSDGVSMLLEVLRAIQLSQAVNAPLPAAQMTASMPRNAQSYQRRALLDELACLQCISICCSRSVEATARLGSTPVGLMPLASSATGQGIRARIVAMQLMTSACDKRALGHGSQKFVAAGHTAVSEAMSTLRLRCSEPVRFRLMVGMLNSGGGSGELQAIGVKFINVFLESSQNLQQRLYLQAELFQAGFEPSTLAKTISPSSPWLDALRNEIKRFGELYVDVEKMLMQARDADRVRSQMVILERRVQILHEEKAVLTSMERRLQERCAELQREIFRLQGAQNGSNFKSLDKQPVALPRHVPPAHSKPDSSEHEDEGISSSETGPSLSPVPILVLPQNTNADSALNRQHSQGQLSAGRKDQDDDEVATIQHVMEELDSVVNEAEKQISISHQCSAESAAKEKDIVPVNIVPQPPRKSRSLAHLISQAGGSDLDGAGSDYDMLMLRNQCDDAAAAAAAQRVNALQTFFDDGDYGFHHTDKAYTIDSPDIPEVSGNAAPTTYNSNATRELLDVIMNARQNDDDPTIKALLRDGGDIVVSGGGHNKANHHHQSAHPTQAKRASYASGESSAAAAKKSLAPAQHFNGVFFMTGMNTPQKYPKPDLSAALQARRVTKNVERLEAAFASHESLVHDAGVILATTREKSRSNQHIYFSSNPSLRVPATTIPSSNASHITAAFAPTVHHGSSATTRTRSYTQGSKVTDIPSGLY